MGYGGAVDNFYDCRVGLLEFVACELDLGRVYLDEGVAGCFLKIICMHGGLHLEMRVLVSLFSGLRRREPGTKVAFNYRPVLFSCSVIKMYNLSNSLYHPIRQARLPSGGRKGREKEVILMIIQKIILYFIAKNIFIVIYQQVCQI